MKSILLVAAFTFLMALLVPSKVVARGRDEDDLSAAEIAAVMNVSFLGQSNLPRGIRNNNPGNLVINSANHWTGKVPISQNTDGTFEQFNAYVYGTRAMIRLIRDSYIKRDQLNTLELLLHKYSPMSENDTLAYINQMVKRTGFGRGEILTTDYAVIKAVVQGMAAHENGRNDAVTDVMFAAAWSIA